MNFNPTLPKAIVSLIIALAVGVIYMYSVIPAGFCNDGVCADFGPQLSNGIVGFVLSAVLIYVIWSFIQKKKS